MLKKFLLLFSSICLLISNIYAQPNQQRLIPTNGEANDEFGQSVTTYKNYLAVGAPLNDDKGLDAGAVYIYEKINGIWVEKEKIFPDALKAGDQFGISVSMYGKYLIIGTNAETAYLYRRDGNSWNEFKRYFPTSNGGFGTSVSISATEMMIGAPFDDEILNNSGAVYLYRSGINWNFASKYFPNDPKEDQKFGKAVSVHFSKAVITAPDDNENGEFSGAAYVFENIPTIGWTQTKKLIASDGAPDDQFGESASIHSNLITIGAHLTSDKGSNSGAAYIFEYENNDWVETKKILASDGESGNEFGKSVAVANGKVVVGSILDSDNGSASGSAYLFEKNDSGEWQEVEKLLPNDGSSASLFGFSVAIYGYDIIIGAVTDTNENGSNAGIAYVFQLFDPYVSDCLVFDAADAAAYSDGWQATDNGGIGFNNWYFNDNDENPNRPDFFIGSSASNGDGDSNVDGDIDVNGNSWGLRIFGGNEGYAQRGMPNLDLDDELSLYFDNGNLDDESTVGITLIKTNNLSSFTFSISKNNGILENYYINDDNGRRDTGISFTDEGLELKLRVLNENKDYVLNVRNMDDNSEYEFNGRLRIDPTETITSIRIFNFDAGEPIANAVFVNKIEICKIELPITDLHEYTLLASEEITTSKFAFIEGNIHSNEDIEIKKGRDGEINGNITAVEVHRAY